eukprot:1388444-Alexandrium_andersonii.AAC.1
MSYRPDTAAETSGENGSTVLRSALKRALDSAMLLQFAFGVNEGQPTIVVFLVPIELLTAAAREVPLVPPSAPAGAGFRSRS